MSKNPLAVFVCLAVLLLSAVPGARAAAAPDLRPSEQIDYIVHSSTLAATHVGIKAVDLRTGETLVDRNAEKLFVPASNVKILTAYSALKVLSPHYTFRTEFSADRLRDGRARNLYVKGYGDPMVTLADINYQAMTVAGRLKKVEGDIVVDTSFFDGLSYGKGWMWDEGIVPWNAPVAPYAVNGNCIDIVVRPGRKAGGPVEARVEPETSYAEVVVEAVTGGPNALTVRREETPSGDRYIVDGSLGSGARRLTCTVSRPGLYAGTLFKELLERYGVEVKGKVAEGATPEKTDLVGRFDSRTLGEVVRYFLKTSDNLTGECILKTLGAAQNGAPGTAAKGEEVVRRTLGGIGIGSGEYRLVDGSGLSTLNQVSPDIVIRVLRAAYDDYTVFPELSTSLSVAGIDGTLKRRLRTTPLAGNLHGKTGTMSGVSCVSGYMQTKKGTWLAVSVMMNGFTGSSYPLKRAQDEILELLWENY